MDIKIEMPTFSFRSPIQFTKSTEAAKKTANLGREISPVEPKKIENNETSAKVIKVMGDILNAPATQTVFKILGGLVVTIGEAYLLGRISTMENKPVVGDLNTADFFTSAVMTTAESLRESVLK